MKTFLILFTALTCLLFTACSTRRHPPLPVAKSVDLKKYSGKWHEIARLPNAFQRDDSAATAEYTVQTDGSVAVTNTELRPDRTTRSIKGKATEVTGSNGARLQVQFGGLAALAPVSKEGNYWIIAVEPDYSLALVGTPNRKYLWLLARSRNAKPGKLADYICKSKELGFATEKLLRPLPPSASR